MADTAAVVLLLAVSAIALTTFRDYGMGWDDLTHSQYGELLLAFYGSGFHDTRAFSFVNLYMYGGGFDMAAALLAKMLPLDLFDMRRLLGAALGILGLFATWRIGRRIGGPLAGLIALALLTACPLYYGHMFMNPKDGPFAVMMAITLLGIVRAIEEYPQPRFATVVLFGLGIGLAIGSRIMGGFAAIYALAGLAMIFSIEARNHGSRRASVRVVGFLRAIWPSILIAVAAMAIVWPWSVLSPLNLPRTLIYFSHFFEKPWRELFGGQLILAPDMPRIYAPALMGLKLPEILLALAIAGFGGVIFYILQPAFTVRRRAVLFVVLLAASLPVIVAVATRPAMYNGIRHFIFMVPPIALLGGLAAAYLFEREHGRGRAADFLAWVAVIGGISLPVIEMVRLHPYQYVYFNGLAGGVAGAENRYMLDYWGLSFKQASQGLLAELAKKGIEPNGGRKWRIAVCGPHPPAAHVLGDRFELSWDTKDADFAMMLGAFYCAKPDAPVITNVTREGVSFSRVYDIRGRNIPSLFTIPPVLSN